MSGTLFFTMSFAQTSNDVVIFPPESKPFGFPHEHYVTEVWKLIYSTPNSTNPLQDTTGDWCTTYAQSLVNSSVVYLTATSGGASERTCIIPSGSSAFIEIVSAAASDGEKKGASIDRLDYLAKFDQDHVTSRYLKINNQEITGLEKYRFHTEPFDFTAPKGAMFGIPPGHYNAVADGYYVMTKPLLPGNYSIESKGSVVCLDVDCMTAKYATENNYKIIVK
jgi:hypothetical protein